MLTGGYCGAAVHEREVPVASSPIEGLQLSLRRLLQTSDEGIDLVGSVSKESSTNSTLQSPVVAQVRRRLRSAVAPCSRDDSEQPKPAQADQ